MSSDVIAADCRIDETALLLFKYLYLEQKEGWYTFKVSGQWEKRDKKDTEEWEWTREKRDFSQGGQDGRNKFTASGMSLSCSGSSSVPAPFSPRSLSGVSFQRDYYVHGIVDAGSQNKTERAVLFSPPLSSCVLDRWPGRWTGLFDVCFVHLSLVWRFNRHAYSYYTQGQTEI